MFVKKIVCLVVLLGIAVNTRAAPVNEDIQLLKYENDNNPDGSYKFGYSQSDGQTREEEASVRYDEENKPILSVRGSYSFTGEDGVVYTVNYVADENGFQAFGAHLPKALGDDSNLPQGLPPSALLSLLG